MQKDLFEKNDFIKDGSLNAEEMESLNKDLFKRFPRLSCEPNGTLHPLVFGINSWFLYL